MLRSELIHTERLVLRRPRVSDAQALFTGYTSDPRATRYLTWCPHVSVEETRSHLELLETTWGQGDARSWVICDKANAEQAVGMITLRLAVFRADLGYVLAPSVWGRGYMPEAVRALVAYAHAEGLYRVSAYCDVKNAQSARVLQKAGLTHEGLLRRYAIHPNVSPEPRDVHLYAACL
jgi:ribosomal-protein-alanine N-acetyltransferase